MVNILISSLLQVALFTAIPFLVYYIRKRTTSGFFHYVGLKRSTARANILGLAVTLFIATPLVILLLTNAGFRDIMTDPKSVSGKVRLMGSGIEAFMTIAIVAVLKTSLSEEIFFRGFVAKRLIAITSFQTGNILQALIFGIIHTLLFMTVTQNILFLSVIFVFPAIGAYLQAYLNEKLAAGSIVPGWIAHGFANIVSYSAVLLMKA